MSIIDYKYYDINFYVDEILSGQPNYASNPYPYSLWKNRHILSGFIKTVLYDDGTQNIAGFYHYGNFGTDDGYKNYLLSDTAFDPNNLINIVGSSITFEGGINIEIQSIDNQTSREFLQNSLLKNIIKNKIKRYYPDYDNNMDLYLNISSNNGKIKFKIYDRNNNNYDFLFNNFVTFTNDIIEISQPTAATTLWYSVSYVVVTPPDNPYNIFSVKEGDVLLNGFFQATFTSSGYNQFIGKMNNFYNLNIYVSNYTDVLAYPYLDDPISWLLSSNSISYYNINNSYSLKYNDGLSYNINNDKYVSLSIKDDNVLSDKYKTFFADKNPDGIKPYFVILNIDYGPNLINVHFINDNDYNIDDNDYNNFFYPDSISAIYGPNPIKCKPIFNAIGKEGYSRPTVKWYDIKLYVNTPIDPGDKNPLAFTGSETVPIFSGYIKANVTNDPTGKYGTITELYDLTQIGKDGKYINLLQNNNNNNNDDNLIYFISDNLQLSSNGIVINIDNNITFKRKYLKYIRTNYADYSITADTHMYLGILPDPTSPNNVLFKLYDNVTEITTAFNCNNDKINYSKTINNLSSAPNLTASITPPVYYDFSINVDSILVTATNPSSLTLHDTVVRGYIKVDNIITDYTGTFGIVTQFNDISEDIDRTNVLKLSTVLGEDNLIYFSNSKTDFNFIRDGTTKISITKNKILNKYLNYFNNVQPYTDINNLCVSIQLSDEYPYKIVLNVYDNDNINKQSFRDDIYYYKTINTISGLTTIWYEVLFIVKQLDANNNPLSLSVTDPTTVLRGYVKIENIKRSNDNLITGNITAFYDRSQISDDGQYVNILNATGNHLISITDRIITFNNIYIDIFNNITLKNKYLNYINTIYPENIYRDLWINIKSDDTNKPTFTRLYTCTDIIDEINLDSNTSTYYEANLNTIIEPILYVSLETKWYSIQIINPQNSVILDGYFKVEKIRTDYTGTVGIITVFYDNAQIDDNYERIDILHTNTTSYFNTTITKLEFLYDGVYISVQNNVSFLANWLGVNAGYNTNNSNISLHIIPDANNKITISYYDALNIKQSITDITKYSTIIQEIYLPLPPILPPPPLPPSFQFIDSDFLQYKQTSNLLKSTYFIDFLDISGNLISRNGSFFVTNGDVLVNRNDLYLDGNIYVNNRLYTDYLTGNLLNYYFKHNTFFGKNALNNIVKKPITATLGDYNSVIGYSSGYNISGGSYNSMIGYLSGSNIVNNQRNTCIGSGSDVDLQTNQYTSSTAIGYNSKITGNNLVTIGTAAETTCVMNNLYNNGNIIINGNLSVQQNNFTIINLDANLNVTKRNNVIETWIDTLNHVFFTSALRERPIHEPFNNLYYVNFTNRIQSLRSLTIIQSITKNITLFLLLFLPTLNNSDNFYVLSSSGYSNSSGCVYIGLSKTNDNINFVITVYNANNEAVILNCPTNFVASINPFILTVSITTSTIDCRLFYNNLMITNSASIYVSPNFLYSIFNIFNNSTMTFTPGSAFGIGQIIQINRSMTLNEIQKIEGYLASKWGIQNVLPLTHPYNSQNMSTTYDPYVYDANFNGFYDTFINFSPNFYSNANGSYIAYGTPTTNGNLFIANNAIQIDPNNNIGLNTKPSYELDISGSVWFNIAPALKGGNIYSGEYGDGSNNLGIGKNSLFNTLGNDNVFLTGGLMPNTNIYSQNTVMGTVGLSFSNANTSFGYNNLYDLNNLNNTSNNCVLGYNCISSSNTVEFSYLINNNNIFGHNALKCNNNSTTNNCGMGYGVMGNVASSNNCAFGYNNMFSVKTSNNCGFGNNTKYTEATIKTNYGLVNNFIGNESCNQVGNNNCVIGNYSLNNSNNPSLCINNGVIGNYAMYNNTTGQNNTVIGNYALYNNTTGSNNSVVGMYAAYNNRTGNNISGIGNYCLYNTIAGPNDAIGTEAMYNNTDGSNNVAIGTQSLYKNTSGSYNVAVGHQSLYNNTTGKYNIAIGYKAGYNNKNQGNNIFIGNYADLDSSANPWENSVALGNDAKIKASNQVVIGTITGNVYIPGNLTVYGNAYSRGSLVTSSDYRIKDNIVHLDEKYIVNHLNPVVYENILTKNTEFGFLAHEVQEKYPELVQGEKDGKEYQRLNYTNLITLALNETKKLKKKIQELKKEIKEREDRINNFLEKNNLSV